MTLDEIKSAVEAGKTVHWVNEGYVVCKDLHGRWHTVCLQNDHCIGLTWLDGVTMNGSPEQFYIAGCEPTGVATADDVKRKWSAAETRVGKYVNLDDDTLRSLVGVPLTWLHEYVLVTHGRH
jgi:hypothetical protein